MTKAELIERVAKTAKGRCSKKLVSELVESVFDNLQRSIKKDKRFTYPGFGTWTVKKRKARKGRNPKTGEVIQIAPTKTVAFKPAPNMKASIN